MDFSSVPRALESLRRRHPPLENQVLEASDELAQSASLTSADFCHLVKVLLDSTSNKNNDAADTTKTTSTRWEPLAVGIFVATEVLQHQIPRLLEERRQKQVGDAEDPSAASTVYMDGPRVPSMVTTANSEETPEALITPVSSSSLQWNFPDLNKGDMLTLCRETLHPLVLEHLEHKEPRVRTLVAKAAGTYCKVTLLLGEGQDLRREIHGRVVSSIQSHLEQGRSEAEQQSTSSSSDSSTPQYSKSSTGALDDTTGWRALETNWQCLAALINAMGRDYFDDFPLDEQLLKDMQHSSIVHVNRHVRAAGMAVLEQCIAAAVQLEHSEAAKALLNPSGVFGPTMIAVLRDGLADNWSQVRMAASVLCRAYFVALQKLSVDWTPIFPPLLPRMCLNRFYLAQGVKLYSHETWRLLFGNEGSGIGHVVNQLPAIARYYVKMCDADNHVVREAACQAIAELAMRLGEDTNHEYHAKLQPHVDLLLQALLMCFHDESWPVRDEACLACGILCRSYPEECRPELDTLWQRWTEQLTDQIWSVRQDAAVALGDALEAYGPDFMSKLVTLLKELLPSAKKQPAMTLAEYKARQNDAAAHTDSQLFSCGSLAPKLKKAGLESSRKDGAGRIGCSSCDVTRERQLWEATDGCIYMIRELVVRCTADNAVVPLTDAEIEPWLRELVDVCRVRHFPQADDMRATLWRQVPAMAEALGKMRFKRNGYLEIFTDLLFRDMESSSCSQLCQHAAGQCAEELANFMGVGIFRGRLEDYQRETFDRVLRERQAMPKGPSMAGEFSPFGPPGLLDGVGMNPAAPPSAVFPGRV